MSRRLPRQSGFTLLEMIIAITIFATISLTIWSIFRSAAAVRQELEARAEITAMGRVAVERMRREISLAFLANNDIVSDHYKTIFVARDRDPFDELTFTSLSHTPLYANRKECDQTEISYFERSDPDSSFLLLMHRESGRIDEDPERGGIVHVLAHRVKELNFRYFDDWDEEDPKWVDEWDTESGETEAKLPRMVEIQLILVDDEGREYPFFTRTFVKSRNH